ncbi:serine--tRNA ligase, partial [Candidatus Sumerlaeota bacterium]|nr:serine--tRNA ligase [Candidatus Sumerlaeota bacterium]
EPLIGLDARRRELTVSLDSMNHQRNTQSKAIGPKIKAGENVEALKEEVRQLGERIKEVETQIAAVDAELRSHLLRIPNPPHRSVPHGNSEKDNRNAGEWGTKPEFAFTPKTHWDLGENLGMLDLAAGTKISGSGFYVLRGAGARLERALINWMIDVHTREHGYTEILPPHLVTGDVMTGTGQLPKMADDMYKIEADDLWLIPTAEVPVTNIHREEILEPDRIPLFYCAYTPCFRREAGSYGKEVRGITRVHQFNKVEMVQFTRPEDSYAALETLRGHAETLLQRLGLAYRILELCAADLSFAAAKCYDLEVWAPGMGLWLEVSSCSNFEDFQARRANIRFRPQKGAKPQFVHTLNGSGLALPRCVIAIMETYQQADGSIKVPEVLVPFMGCDRIAPA